MSVVAPLGIAPPDGATRLIPIIGDPIAQVKSPAGMTAALHARGVNAYVMPLHVDAAAVDACLDALSRARNVDAVLATVPHKFAAFRHAATATPRATLLGAANVLRRNPDGTWHADMTDGIAFVAALRGVGCDPAGQRALLVGAGGAGRLTAGSSDPTGLDIIANATPAGMRAEDPPPVQTAHLSPAMTVGDVITVPEVTKLLGAARAIGCATSTGVDMFVAGRDLIVDFVLGR